MDPYETLGYTLALKRRIFHKWKVMSLGREHKNLDFQGNEYYLLNGIICYHLSKPGFYKFGKTPRLYYGQNEREEFKEGWYVMSTRKPNYEIIEDPDILHFILHFDLFSGKSIHRELKKRMGVEFSFDAKAA